MIDIKELRRLAQAATPGPWINHGRQPNVAGLPHSAVAAKTLLARVYSEAYGDVEQETANASFIAAANPAAISELLDRLEATEEDRSNFLVEIGKLCAQCDALRAKITEMEKQAPIGTAHAMPGASAFTMSCFDVQDIPVGAKLYALPGAQTQPAPSVPREAIEKMLTQLMDIAVSNGANSVSMPDEYVEVAAWLCGISAQPAPSVPDGWLRAIDEALVVTHLGVANESDTYEQAKAMLDNLLRFHVDMAIDPAVNGGYKLVPIEPTDEMLRAIRAQRSGARKGRGDRADWKAWLAAAPEAKP